jgi:hypothetical protein
MIVAPENLKALCTYIIEPDGFKVDPDATWVYLNGEDVTWEESVRQLAEHPRKFSLIWAGTDRPFTWIMFRALKHKLVHVYAVNCEIRHPQVTLMPLGLKEPQLMAPVTERPRELLCYANFGDYMTRFICHRTAQVMRDHCREVLPDWVTTERQITQPEFYRRMMSAKFVICPMGVGQDTWRFYEAVWYGATPIVLSSGLDELHRKFGALIVEDWSDLTPELLEGFDRQPLDKKVFNISEYIPNAGVV